MRPFTIYTAECTGNARNCQYPTEVIVQDIPTLQQAMGRDHVCAKYHDDRRSAASFQWSDCIPMDCDNDHSEDPADWKQPEDVAAAFPDVSFAVCYSRNHMKEKNGKAARPKFHCYFPVKRITDSKVYTAMKRQLQKRFPWFDANAMDAARFYFGTKEPQIMFFVGEKTVDQVLPELITAGSRNATLSQKAGCLIKRYGGTAKAEQLFRVEAARCVPPLSDQELDSIWSSAKKFGERIARREDYIPPEQFNTPAERLAAMHPESNRRYAWSDIGASRLFADYYKDIVRYVPERKSWYCYGGGVWSADVGNLRHFEEAEQDRTLKAAFSRPENQSAILNWLVEGYRLTMQEGLQQPAAVKAATAEYKRDSDKVTQFVEEKLEAASLAETKTSLVYDCYRAWCSENGCYAESNRNFNQALRSFAEVVRKHPREGGGQTTLLRGYRIKDMPQAL